jgi:predicted TIM-barrel fold metal-dependent hydrolase
VPDAQILDPDLEITDAHHHLWHHHDPVYLLDDLLADCATGHRITKTVFVECGWSWDEHPARPELAPLGEVRRVAEVATESERRGLAILAAIVGFADLRAGDAVGDVLDQLTDTGAGRFVGVRQSTTWDPSPAFRPHPTKPGPGLLAAPEFRRGFRQLARRELTFDAWLYHTQLDELLDLAHTFPEVHIVIDHLGAPLRTGPYANRQREVREVWSRRMSALAECPNVLLKLGGIGMPALAGDELPVTDPAPAMALAEQWRDSIRWCIEEFGVDRCMFESNFPVDKRRVTYRDLWNAFKMIVVDASADEKAALFRRTADQTYRLSA